MWQALRKKQLVAQGKLGKFGKVLDSTPASVKVELESLCSNGAQRQPATPTIAAATVIKVPIHL